jgi:hypothetical protein
MILRVHNGWKILGRPEVYSTRAEAYRALSGHALTLAATLIMLGCAACRPEPDHRPDIAGPCPPAPIVRPVGIIVQGDAVVGMVLRGEYLTH